MITANDCVHDPGLCGCPTPRFNDLLMSPKRLSPKRLVAQITVHLTYPPEDGHPSKY